MYCEAKSIIDKLNLKKDNSIKKFQVFKKDNVVLTITGIGNVYAFSATSYIAGKFNISEYDTFINIGICGTVNKNVSRGDLIIGNKDRKSTRLNSSHANISYAVFCLKKKKN